MAILCIKIARTAQNRKPIRSAHCFTVHWPLKYFLRIKSYYKRITKKLKTLATRGFEYTPPPLHFLIFGCVQLCSIPQFPRLYLYYHYNVFFENFNPFLLNYKYFRAVASVLNLFTYFTYSLIHPRPCISTARYTRIELLPRPQGVGIST